MEALDGLFWLRFRLLECCYDTAPRLLEVASGRICLVQKETVAASRQLQMPVSREGRYRISLRDYFDAPGEAEVFVKAGSCYKKAEITARRDDCLEFRYGQEKGRFLPVLLVV
ncbi:MAG: hypothetical protein K2N94_08400, partial [Lachnospiraceae bacterium]|nr:hypothetical protein [Lachnospiraceae bacterium]